ncbi:MAG: agmatine deiminase family protein [Puniceicoccaceae bacterium]|nr:agmatine deiminase family protein [Puniceicoccaceae bacterium]
MSVPQPAGENSLGYRLPAEWESQEAVWFAWPVREDIWPEKIDKVREQLVDLYILAARFQQVRILCPSLLQAPLRALLVKAGSDKNILLYNYQTDDIWIRDFGPLFMLSLNTNHAVSIDCSFNAWGNKFPQQSLDDAATKWIAHQLKIRCFNRKSLVLEGGSIDSNGSGTLLTTKAVLMNPNRLGPERVEEIELIFKRDLSIDKVLWLNEGLIGDDTDGHVDNVARFFKPYSILVATASKDSKNYRLLEENRSRLKKMSDAKGRTFNIVSIPLPAPIEVNEEPLVASYLNFLVLNNAVLVPTFAQAKSDQNALKIIANCFPGRQIVGFDCRIFIEEGGALHCMSLNQPAALANDQK